MRTLLLTFVSIFIALPLQAEHVDRHEAERAAVQWMAALKSAPVVAEMEAVVRSADTVCYVFNFEEGGFVIVAADDAVLPVLGYAREGAFRETAGTPASDYLTYVRNAVGETIDRRIAPDARISEAWESLRNPSAMRSLSKTAAVGPLVNALWGQDEPFNLACPNLNCNRGAGSNSLALTGCIATSLAMIMHYHGHPVSGLGSVDGYDFSAATYLWALLPNTITSGSPANIKNEVSEIMRHLGAAVQMQYSCESSGAQLAPARDALRYYFRYQNSVQIVTRSEYSAANWNLGLKNEIDNGRPLVYAGLDDNITNGHAWVLDGYDVIGGSTYYHMNWGWYGAYNGYFALDDLTPETLNFNNEQQAIVGIIPNPSNPRLGISQVSWTAPIEGGTSVNISVANTMLGDESVIPFSITPEDSWLSVSKSEGTTPSTFTINAESNTGGVSRTGTVTIRATVPNVIDSVLVFTVSQEGSGASAPSLLVSLEQWQAPYEGGESSVISIVNGNESDTTRIDYTIASSAGWLTLSEQSGTTEGTLILTAEENTTGTPRTATVTIAAQTAGVANSPATISVMQPSLPTTSDTLVVTPASWIAPASGGLSPFVQVSVPGNTLPFTVSVNESWVTPSISGGTTPGGFTLTATDNAGGTLRTATVTISVEGQDIIGSPYEFVVTQSGSTTQAILSVSTLTWSVNNDGGTSSPIQVTNGNPSSSETIEYVVTESLPWLSISQPLGVTPGTFTISADPNASGETRSGQVQVKSSSGILPGSPWMITVTQGAGMASDAKLAVAPRFWTAPAYGGESQEVTVSNESTTETKSIAYTISDDADWITTTKASGATPGNFFMNAQANTTGATRFAVVRITAAGGNVEGSPQDIYITQPPSTGDMPQLGITPAMLTVSSVGDTGRIVQIFNAAPSNSDSFGFDIVDNVSWITFDKLSGEAPETLSMSIDENTGDTARVARIKVTADAGVFQSPQHITVYQSAKLAGSFIEVAMREWNPGPTAVQSPVVNVIGAGGTKDVPYRIRTNVPWLTTTWTYGTTPGTFNIIAASNNANTARTGHVYIADVQSGIKGAEHVITVTQQAFTGFPAMSVSLIAWEAPIGGANSPSVSVANTNSNGSTIAYTVSSDASWLTVNNPSGSTPGTFIMRAQANTGAGSRTATVTVRSLTPGVLDGVQTIAVRQPGYDSGLLSCSTASQYSPNFSARPGDKFDITVSLSKSIFSPGSGDVELSFLLNYDFSGLYPAKIIGMQGNAWFERVGPGTMRAVLSSRSISDGDILRITMELLLGNTDRPVWSLADAATSPSIADIGMDETCAGEVHILPRNGFVTRSDLGIANLGAAYPNPAGKTQPAGITVDVQRPGNVDIRMYTTMGMEAGVVFNGTLETGTHTLAIPSAGLSPGVYLIAMKTADGLKTTRIVISD